MSFGAAQQALVGRMAACEPEWLGERGGSDDEAVGVRGRGMMESGARTAGSGDGASTLDDIVGES